MDTFVLRLSPIHMQALVCFSSVVSLDRDGAGENRVQ